MEQRFLIRLLEIICMEIGYGHALQLIEGWIERDEPGWCKAHAEELAQR